MANVNIIDINIGICCINWY